MRKTFWVLQHLQYIFSAYKKKCLHGTSEKPPHESIKPFFFSTFPFSGNRKKKQNTKQKTNKIFEEKKKN